MKATFFAILGALIGFLMGAFYNVGFDISLWSDGSRFATLILMAMFGAWGLIFSTIGDVV